MCDISNKHPMCQAPQNYAVPSALPLPSAHEHRQLVLVPVCLALRLGTWRVLAVPPAADRWAG